jgi:hypothetical protein
MGIYVFILITFHILVVGIELGQSNKDGVIKATLSFMLYLPVFGRVLGWW